MKLDRARVIHHNCIAANQAPHFELLFTVFGGARTKEHTAFNITQKINLVFSARLAVAPLLAKHYPLFSFGKMIESRLFLFVGPDMKF